MHELEVLILQWFLITEVFQTLGILHLSHTDGGTADFRQFVCTHLREHTGHIT